MGLKKTNFYGHISARGRSSIMSMKTDSAVALKQLGAQSVTVRTRTAAQKLNYLRELISEDPQIEPIYISGDSQRADGLTKILSGSALRERQKGLNLFYPSSQNEEDSSREETKKKDREPMQARVGACIVNRQAGRESISLDSAQDRSGDNSAVLAPVCFACQEGQDQDRECKNMCIMICCRSQVHDNRGGANRRKGRPRGEAPEGQAQSTTGPAHGPGHSQKQEIAQARMKALQHTEVPTSTSSTSSKSKAQGQQQSQPKGVPSSPAIENPIELATDQASASASALESALAAVPSDTDMSPPIREVKQSSSPTWADITAQDEEEQQKSMDDEEAGIQTGDQQQTSFGQPAALPGNGWRRTNS